MEQITRKKYLLEQKERGRILFGVFPAQYPKEILWAMNIVTAEIWDPPLEISGANSHLQSYICPVVSLGMELILQGKCDFLDGFLFPHTCDSVQNMASVINDYMGPGTPCYFFYHPKAPYWPGAQEYYLGQLKELLHRLEKQAGPLDQDKLHGAIKASTEISRLIRQIYDHRSKGTLNCTNREFYEVIRKGEYLLPDRFIPLLEGFLRQHATEQIKPQIPVIVSGVLPNPLELMDKLEDLGLRVAHDDLLNSSRRLLAPSIDTSIDPLEALTKQYFSMPPCSTRGSGIEQRIEYLMGIINRTRAKGVIFNIVKYCEPEWFDVPNLQSALKERGVPTLVLDTEINRGLPGQMVTRIEAFVEMLA